MPVLLAPRPELTRVAFDAIGRPIGTSEVETATLFPHNGTTARPVDPTSALGYTVGTGSISYSVPLGAVQLVAPSNGARATLAHNIPTIVGIHGLRVVVAIIIPSPLAANGTIEFGGMNGDASNPAAASRVGFRVINGQIEAFAAFGATLFSYPRSTWSDRLDGHGPSQATLTIENAPMTASVLIAGRLNFFINNIFVFSTPLPAIPNPPAARPYVSVSSAGSVMVAFLVQAFSYSQNSRDRFAAYTARVPLQAALDVNGDGNSYPLLAVYPNSTIGGVINPFASLINGTVIITSQPILVNIVLGVPVPVSGLSAGSPYVADFTFGGAAHVADEPIPGAQVDALRYRAYQTGSTITAASGAVFFSPAWVTPSDPLGATRSFTDQWARTNRMLSVWGNGAIPWAVITARRASSPTANVQVMAAGVTIIS